MKKKMAALGVFLASALVLGIAAPTTASAAEEEFQEREVTAYLYGLDSTTTMKCYFNKDLPDVPYVSMTDYLSQIFTDKIVTASNGNQTYTVSDSRSSIVIDVENDTLLAENFQKFTNAPIKSQGAMLTNNYGRLYSIEYSDSETLTIDYGTYGIDLIDRNEEVYFPLTSICDLFDVTYNGALYADGKIYFVHNMEYLNNCYFDKSVFYQNNDRSEKMIEYSYNELCLLMDYFYGRPANSSTSDSIAEKGFDKTLDDFSDETRMAKKLLHSDKLSDFIAGLCVLGKDFSDGGHTGFYIPLIHSIGIFTSTPVGSEVLANLKDPSREEQSTVIGAYQSAINRETGVNALKELRQSEYEKYETVRTWDNGIFLVRSGDTCVFVFDSFVNDAVYAFKEALDYADENGVRQFVVDISCNTGGSTGVECYLRGLMTNARNHDNKVTSLSIDMLTKQVTTNIDEIDFNLDGSFDELDKDVAYDFDFSIITSKYSYSCGNLLPVRCQDEGIVILGETSGGGECNLSIAHMADSMTFTVSGYHKFLTKSGRVVDLGATVDYDLTQVNIDEDGDEIIDYTGMYHIETISADMDEFYGRTKEESSEEESSEDESSEDESSEEESSQEESDVESSEEEKSDAESSEESSEESSDAVSATSEPQSQPSLIPGGNPVRTGENDYIWFIIAAMVVAAGTGLALFRKGGNKEKETK